MRVTYLQRYPGVAPKKLNHPTVAGDDWSKREATHLTAIEKYYVTSLGGVEVYLEGDIYPRPVSNLKS